MNTYSIPGTICERVDWETVTAWLAEGHPGRYTLIVHPPDNAERDTCANCGRSYVPTNETAGWCGACTAAKRVSDERRRRGMYGAR